MARGSVTKRGDSWRIAIELEADPLTNKRRQRFETFRGSKKDADKRLTELLALMDQSKLGMTAKVTLGQFFGRWLEDYAANLAPKTYHRYTQYVRNQIKPHAIATVALGKLTPTHLVRFFTDLRNFERLDGRGKLATQTQLNIYRMLHTALESARKWRLIPTNPIEDVESPKVTRSEMKTFTIAEAQAFLAESASEGLRWQAYFTLALTCGLRSGELRGLRWQDVDFNSDTLAVQQSTTRVNGFGLVTRQPKTTGSRRPIALGGEMATLLRQHKAEQNVDRLALGPLWHDNNLAFPSKIGTPLDDKTMRGYFFRICDNAGVPRIRPYDLRHSCASLLLASGVNVKVISERLGHSTVNLTLNTYAHTLPNSQKEAAEGFDKLLKVKA